MSKSRRGLGRGLDALLSNTEEVMAPPKAAEVATLRVDQLQRGQYQPRVDMREETLTELADSIRAQGIIQPLVVREIGTDRYEIIAGERRWRASQLVGLTEVPVVVRNVPDQTAIAMALIENIQREDLNPLEEANSLQRLIEEFDLTHADAAKAVGRSRTAVSNLLRLRDLSPQVKEMVENGRLDMGHARALLSLPEVDQIDAARKIADQGLTVRGAEQLVRTWQMPSEKKAAPAKRVDPDIARLQADLSDKLAANVVIQDSKGKGKLVIKYNSLDELDGILAKFGA